MVLRLLLHIWSGCGGLLNEVAVADMKRSHRGDAPDRALAVWLQQCCRVHWARHSMQGSSELDRGLLYVVQTAFGRVVECGRVKCA